MKQLCCCGCNVVCWVCLTCFRYLTDCDEWIDACFNIQSVPACFLLSYYVHFGVFMQNLLSGQRSSLCASWLVTTIVSTKMISTPKLRAVARTLLCSVTAVSGVTQKFFYWGADLAGKELQQENLADRSTFVWLCVWLQKQLCHMIA